MGVTEQPFCRGRRGYGGLKGEQAKRFGELKRKNTRLRKGFVDLNLDKLFQAAAELGVSERRAAECWARLEPPSVTVQEPTKAKRRKPWRSSALPSALADRETHGLRPCRARKAGG